MCLHLGHDIEKQWKNLKDSYFKLRKKVKIDASGKLVQPRWKYFSAMMFLDRLSNGSASFSGVNTSVCDEINHTALVHQESYLGKRNADGNLTPIVSGRHFIDGRCRIRKAMISNTTDRNSTESTPLAAEDEYSAFCKWYQTVFLCFILEISELHHLRKLWVCFTNSICILAIWALNYPKTRVKIEHRFLKCVVTLKTYLQNTLLLFCDLCR